MYATKPWKIDQTGEVIKIHFNSRDDNYVQYTVHFLGIEYVYTYMHEFLCLRNG